MNLETLLNSEGTKGVEIYRQSIEQRNATGKTKESVESSVVVIGESATLTIRGRKDIGTLETGVTAEQFRASGATFQDINQWVQARGLGDSAVTGLIFSSLEQNGWNTDKTRFPNRTGENGGTKGIITNPTQQIIKNVGDAVEAISKDLVLDSIKF